MDWLIGDRISRTFCPHLPEMIPSNQLILGPETNIQTIRKWRSKYLNFARFVWSLAAPLWRVSSLPMLVWQMVTRLFSAAANNG